MLIDSYEVEFDWKGTLDRMSARSRWQGCRWVLPLWPLASSLAAEPPPDTRLPTARQRRIELEYAVPRESLPLTQVQVWHTTDLGVSWRSSADDPDAQSPAVFEAASDGLYGFWMVLTNALGASGAAPAAGSAPQHWVLVDATAPLIQLHAPSVSGVGPAAQVLAIRWTAVDAYLSPRPIEVTYRTWPDGAWQRVAAPLANTGRYDWSLPDGTTGPIELRVSVRDRGGNVATQTSGKVDLLSPAGGLARVALHASSDQAEVANAKVSEDDRRRARQLYQRGTIHQLQNESELAASRFRDALRLDPTLTAALVDLGSVLYAQGGYEEAIDTYRLALGQDVRSRAALNGIAQAYLAKRDYVAGRSFLEQLVADRPNDVRGWLSLGDLAIAQRDEIRARDCYVRAASRDPDATDVIAAARARLAELSGSAAGQSPLASRAADAKRQR